MILMSVPAEAQPGKLIIGLLVSQQSLIPAVVADLKMCYGPIDMISPWFRFDFTNYYHAEMGAPLHRRLMIFHDLVAQDQLADIKLQTNAVEARFLKDARRQVNIDPGYLLYERFVLATGKNYSHRIYLGRRIYADLTLVFRKGAYQALPWTYPDYATEEMRTFLLGVRQKYAQDLKAFKQHTHTENEPLETSRKR
jgi:Domain of unknown function (DUF4416)